MIVNEREALLKRYIFLYKFFNTIILHIAHYNNYMLKVIFKFEKIKELFENRL